MMIDVTIQSLEDQGFRLSASFHGEDMGSIVVPDQRHAKTWIFRTLCASWIDPDSEISIQGDIASEFISEFINDANGMMETLAIRHDL